jgi:adenylosuccinate synthase
MKTKIDVVVDMQYGSTGKGAIAGYLATHRDYDTVITANTPNSGHTFIDIDGNVMIHKVLPNSVVGENVFKVLIGPGAVFSMARLQEEMDQLFHLGYDTFNVFIHDHAVILEDRHKVAEGNYDRIGSTKQGSAAALMEKIDRDPACSPLAREYHHHHNRIEIIPHTAYLGLLQETKHGLLECSQGYSLGLNSGFWPYCTSRECTVAAFLSHASIPHSMLGEVVGSTRTYPIRVGGTSGPCYKDQFETSWERLGVPEEKTTVTKKVRRVFTFSRDQMVEAIMVNQPDSIFLNFCNYMARDQVESLVYDINAMLRHHVGGGSRVRFLGWGPKVDDIEEIE